MKVTIGGERLGSGNKNRVKLPGFGRSTHDMGYIWRSSMSAGTLVPFMSELALNGDDWDIKLNCEVLTQPTVGPLYGSYKVQLDVFKVPIRLYQAMLHMNMVDIGLKMEEVTLPQILVQAKKADKLNTQTSIDNQQINSSSLLSYLGIRGVGYQRTGQRAGRLFNGVKVLAYYDIGKQYYCNKQEENAQIIHNDMLYAVPDVITVTWIGFVSGYAEELEVQNITGAPTYVTKSTTLNTRIEIQINEPPAFEDEMIDMISVTTGNNGTNPHKIRDIFNNIQYDPSNGTINCTGITLPPSAYYFGAYIITPSDAVNENGAPRIVEFPLKNIDEARLKVLSAGREPVTIVGANTDYLVPGVTITDTPYSLMLKTPNDSTFSINSNQEGLLLKTYQSDLYNNWMNTDWITGDNGINELTKITIVDGAFTLDELNINKKLYNMLNKIAVSGGTYDDWNNVVYGKERVAGTESPIYCGGLSKELVFQTVVSNTGTEDEPLGTLAGRGVMGNKHKGGRIAIKADEASYIMGIVSITPRIDYSQGNKWDNNLKNMDELHKPDLDAIGYQDLITDQMAWFDSESLYQENPYEQQWAFKSAGKQPAWLNYMTNVNETRGTFAEEYNQMFMTLNRRYDVHWVNDDGNLKPEIKDLTTYVDPTKFNYVFADTRLDAQNFMVQISVEAEARRVMSSKQIPNL